mmetsp:Transcript_49943/g.108508  ORF Transcript_49943/g.108508 Transcript_49943/m.108508 type:complete len:137 (-) Transcript_49943:287-697(-)
MPVRNQRQTVAVLVGVATLAAVAALMIAQSQAYVVGWFLLTFGRDQEETELYTWTGAAEASQRADMIRGNPVKTVSLYTWGGRLEASQQRDMIAGNPIKAVTPYTWGGRLQAAQQRDMVAGVGACLSDAHLQAESC